MHMQVWQPIRLVTSLTAAIVWNTICTDAAPVTAPGAQHLHHARSLLGSSFGLPGTNATYDYVVVGGGTAGLTLATRLVEQKAGTVAVIEAGSFYEITNSNISEVPATDGVFASKGLDDWQPLIDWGYITTPQAGAFNERIHYPRGKTLGGCSARNYMAYQRGTEESYQRWADAVQDDSYTWESFLPFFEKSLDFTPPDMNFRGANSTPSYDDSVVGSGNGPLSLTFSHYAQAFGSWATKGLEAIGLPIIDGLQSGKLMGQSYSMFTINATTMHRDSSETSFLRQGLQYDDYFVYHLTLAKQVLFDADKKATGVLVDTQGAQYVLSANKEVILSGGVFGSPQLLMASGIGPAETLDNLGIEVLSDLAGVGQNMQDHVYFGVTYPVNAPTISSLVNDPVYAAQQAELYNNEAAGMYGNPVTEVLGWEKTPQSFRNTWSNSTLGDLAKYPSDWPEIEYLALAAYIGDQWTSRGSDPNDGNNYASLAVSLCTPLSRGTVTITSPDTAVAPAIDPNWMTHPADMAVLVAGFKRAREFWATDAMQEFVTGEEAWPGSNVTTDAEIEDNIRASFNTIYHAACTCAMGPSSDSMAVVDTQARVYGVQGLRVVDAAAFPILPPGHPMATVYAFAEKIACDISGNC